MHPNPTILASYLQAEDDFFRAISLSCMDGNPGTVAYLTGVPASSFNLAYIHALPTSLEATLETIRAFFSQSPHLPFTIYLPEGLCTEESAQCFTDLGYQPDGQTIAMWCALKGESLPQLESDIQSTNHCLHDWASPLVDAFDCAKDIVEHYAATHQRALDTGKSLHHFTLYQQGQPIATLTLSHNKNLVRIDDVATLPQYQRQGHATQLLHHALTYAQNLGAEYCFLEATEDGLSVYQKLGFVPLFKRRIYAMELS
jgi:GNAT superfamily N-acetyltransferase